MDIIESLFSYIEKIGFYVSEKYAYRKNFLVFGMQYAENNAYRKCGTIRIYLFDKIGSYRIEEF